jgi:hypothetical protein
MRLKVNKRKFDHEIPMRAAGQFAEQPLLGLTSDIQPRLSFRLSAIRTRSISVPSRPRIRATQASLPRERVGQSWWSSFLTLRFFGGFASGCCLIYSPNTIVSGRGM